MAPAEVFATAAVNPTALRLGMITPWAPAKLAVRMMAPRLCGSSMPSSKMINGGSPLSLARARISSTWTYP